MLIPLWSHLWSGLWSFRLDTRDAMAGERSGGLLRRVREDALAVEASLRAVGCGSPGAAEHGFGIRSNSRWGTFLRLRRCALPEPQNARIMILHEV